MTEAETPKTASLSEEQARAIAAMGFEEALAELEKIVQQLERDQVPLDEAIGAYERGVLLKRQCESKLAEAKAKIEKISLAPDGTALTEPMDLG